MKLQLYFLALFLLLSACKTTTKLPTDNNQTIDISGNFNATDAEIAINDIYLAFQESEWYLSEITDAAIASKAYVQNFEVNLDNKSYINKLLKSALNQQLNDDDQMEQLKAQNKSMASYVFRGKLSVTERNEDQNSVTYQLNVVLTNTDNETVWQKTDFIKKYLNN
jgi:ABC-type uncharacterized transport system auxiliary subunit